MKKPMDEKAKVNVYG